MNTAACCGREHLFFAEELDSAAVHNATDTNELNTELEYLNQAVQNVKTALNICADCPLLQACKQETARLTESNAAPCGVVRAGIYWGYQGRPDPTLNGSLTAEASNRIRESAHGELAEATVTNDAGDEFPKTIKMSFGTQMVDSGEAGFIDEDFTPWDYSWIPPLSAPINEIAVQAALSQDPRRPVVTERWLALNHHPITPEALRAEVLTDADVCEVIRRADATGIATRRVSSILRMKWDFVQRLRQQLGVSIPTGTLTEQTPVTVENFDAQWQEAAPWQQLALL